MTSRRTVRPVPGTSVPDCDAQTQRSSTRVGRLTVTALLAVLVVSLGAAAYDETRPREPAGNAGYTDEGDQHYLGAVRAQWSTETGHTDAELIDMGHHTCDAIGAIGDVGLVVGDLDRRPGVDNVGAMAVVNAAVAAYCPRFGDRLDTFARGR
jgi:hypothetical protein